MSYGSSPGRYSSAGLGISSIPGSSSGYIPSALLSPKSKTARDKLSPRRSYPLSSSLSSTVIPSSSISRARSPLASTGISSSYIPSSGLLNVTSPYSDRTSARSVSPSVGYSSRLSPSSGVLKTLTPSSKYGSKSSTPNSGYSLSGSRSASSLVPTRRLIGHSDASNGQDRYRSNRSSRPLADSRDNTPSRLSDQSSRNASLNSSTSSLNDDGEKDYKKLYIEVRDENERLKSKLKKSEDELDSTKRQLDKLLQNNKNSLSDAEKREKRALERRLSEMEEESKEMEILFTDNQRLKDENAALIRVISKLSK